MYRLAELYRRYFEAVKRDQERCTHGNIIEDKGHRICFYCNKVFDMYDLWDSLDVNRHDIFKDT